jgi:hypothetical protein
VQLGQDLAGRAGPEVDHAAEGFGDPEGALEDRVGDGAAAHLLQIVRAAFEGGAGDGGPQAGLGGDLAAMPAQGAVPMGGVDGLPGVREGVRDVGEVEQRG